MKEGRKISGTLIAKMKVSPRGLRETRVCPSFPLQHSLFDIRYSLGRSELVRKTWIHGSPRIQGDHGLT